METGNTNNFVFTIFLSVNISHSVSIKINEIFRICTEGPNAGKHVSDFLFMS